MYIRTIYQIHPLVVHQALVPICKFPHPDHTKGAISMTLTFTILQFDKGGKDLNGSGITANLIRNAYIKIPCHAPLWYSYKEAHDEAPQLCIFSVVHSTRRKL